MGERIHKGEETRKSHWRKLGRNLNELSHACMHAHVFVELLGVESWKNSSNYGCS